MNGSEVTLASTIDWVDLASSAVRVLATRIEVKVLLRHRRKVWAPAHNLVEGCDSRRHATPAARLTLGEAKEHECVATVRVEGDLLVRLIKADVGGLPHLSALILDAVNQ